MFMKSFRMDLARAKEMQTKGSISAIYHRTNALTKLLLGPGKGLYAALCIMVVLDAASMIALAQTGSILILSTLESSAATGTPKEMASGLLLLSTTLVVIQLVKYFLHHHAGSWFMRRAKYAVSKKDDLTPGNTASMTSTDTAHLMQDLSEVNKIFISDRFYLISRLVVVIAAVCCIGAYDFTLMATAAGLVCVGEILAAVDDLMVIQEQVRERACRLGDY